MAKQDKNASAAAEARAKFEAKQQLYAGFWWLTDVPTFIDVGSVERFHDAVVQPEFELLERADTAEQKKTDTIGTETEVSGGFELPAFLKFKLGTKITGGREDETGRSSEITKRYVRSAENRLQDVVALYKEVYPDRVFFQATTGSAGGGSSALASLAGPSDWGRADALLDQPGPRPLVFLDLNPGTKIYPMAAELVGGAVLPLFGELERRAEKALGQLPAYPRQDASPDRLAQRAAYWTALFGALNNRDALEVVESCGADGKRIDWIDYRMPLPGRDDPIHLHMTPSGQFPTGVFAYYFVRRAYQAGVRLVGLLKGNGDVNVLAFYER